MTDFSHWLLGRLPVGRMAPAFARSNAARLPVLATIVVCLCSAAQAQNKTSAGCSPIVADNTSGGNVTVTLNCNFGVRAEDSFEVQLLQAKLSCNSKEEKRSLAEGEDVSRAADLFKQLQKLDEAFAYVDLSVWVGAGCGLYEVENQPAPRWGVVYTDELRPGKGKFYLDAFPGPINKYDYGYRIEFDSVKGPDNVTCRREPLPGEADFIFCNQASTLLFPSNEGAFFNARYGKSFHLEGIAKIRLTEWQGGQAVEIVPATPVGGLANHYNRLKNYIRNQYQNTLRAQ